MVAVGRLRREGVDPRFGPLTGESQDPPEAHSVQKT